MRRVRSRFSIATQVLLMQCVLVLLLTGAGSVAAVLQARATEHDGARRQVLSTAEAVAGAPSTVAALHTADPTVPLLPVTTALEKQAGVDFVVVMTTAGIRFTHPNPTLIGKTFVGHIAPAVAGKAFTENYRGSLGPSVRSVVPIRDPQAGNRVIGLVSVGITQHRLSALFARQLPMVVGISAAALALAVLGAYAVGRRVRRQTRGLGPVALAELYEHHDAVMHAMREGLLLLDPAGKLILANDEAVRLLDLPAARAGRTPAELGVDGSLGAVLAGGADETDGIHLTDNRVLTVNQSTARRAGRDLGTVVTLRDRTELQALTDELASVRGFAEALRASNHEAANRLHTVVTLIELDRAGEAVRFATGELAAQQQLVDRLLTEVEEPVLAALVLGKVAQARERGIELGVGEVTAVRELPLPVTDAVTLVGNLIDNAVEAVAGPEGRTPKRVWIELSDDASGLTVRVADTGPGIPPELREEVFVRGFTTKAEAGRGLGLALVAQIVNRHHGSVTVSEADGGGAVLDVRIPRDARIPSDVGAPSDVRTPRQAGQ
ncbi:sensor histidine kinase [Catenulispora sp. NF23]|uniref:sensor histidine kinase n=1 Tax=Catenulispora pinistramenti TaxID=2705254 RepID=UPI001BA7877C|nr:sensor histidine kinase [Catenulispora pinistramenti]MBS2535804.1 sensor histidine kinase [Catenulispora pinistramenti]